ncbi:MAG: restriction endonuclease subunit S, partial [Pedobacter sp.]
METLQPKLRFPEFKVDWEKKTLGDLGQVSMCKRILKEQTAIDGEIPFYKIGTFGKVAD